MTTTLGSKLRNLRDERELTIREVSRLTGLGVNTISRWENDKVLPKTQHLSDLAAFYKVGLGYFSDGEYSLKKLHHRLDALERRVQIIEKKFAEGLQKNERSTSC